jgi:hypothetical protein
MSPLKGSIANLLATRKSLIAGNSGSPILFRFPAEDRIGKTGRK